MAVTNHRSATQVRTANVRFAGERHRDCSLRDLAGVRVPALRVGARDASGILASVTA